MTHEDPREIARSLTSVTQRSRRDASEPNPNTSSQESRAFFARGMSPEVFEEPGPGFFSNNSLKRPPERFKSTLLCPTTVCFGQQCASPTSILRRGFRIRLSSSLQERSQLFDCGLRGEAVLLAQNRRCPVLDELIRPPDANHRRRDSCV